MHYLIRDRKKLMRLSAYAGRDFAPRYPRGRGAGGPKSATPNQRANLTAKSLIGQNRTAKKITTGKVASPTIHLCCVASKPNEANRSRPRTENE